MAADGSRRTQEKHLRSVMACKGFHDLRVLAGKKAVMSLARSIVNNVLARRFAQRAKSGGDGGPSVGAVSRKL